MAEPARPKRKDQKARIQISRVHLTRPYARRGLHSLGLRSDRDCYLYVPREYDSHNAPLIMLLHGAGGDGLRTLPILQDLADARGFFILAPTAQGATWDFLIEDFGADVTMIERALNEICSIFTFDQTRFAIGGFSDGASYALTLGLTNGDLFSHIIAYSPGFMLPPSREGHPKIFVSHGTKDSVLPIHACSHRIVPNLERSGYPVLFDEFDGPHTVPRTTAEKSVQWFLKRI